jgi:hypothetical protein
MLASVAAETDAPSDLVEHLSARAMLALLGQEPAQPVEDLLEQDAERVPCIDRSEIRYLLWKATGNPGPLRAAHRDLVLLEDQAPPASRTLVGRLPMYREIRQAVGMS